MRIVIIGCGKIGGTLAGMLSGEGHEIIAVDNDRAVADAMGDLYDVMGVHGNGASLEVQKEAQVARADLVVATTAVDEANILICILARRLGAKRTIARVRNPEYSEQLEFLREDIGLSMHINPEQAAADEVFRTIVTPVAHKVETFAGGRAEIIEMRVRADSGIAGAALRDVPKIMKSKMLVCAVRRGEAVFIPNGDFVLAEGDAISIVASISEAEGLFRRWETGRRRAPSVMILGGSRIAYYLSRRLLEAGGSVTVIDSDEARCARLCEILPRASVVRGDGTDPALLAEEGIGGADAFVALTGADESNVIVSMYARSLGVKKVITKVNRRELGSMAAAGMLDSVFSPKSVCANIILQYVRSMANSAGSNVETLYRLVDERVEALEFVVRNAPGVTGVPLRDLRLKPSLLIACIIRGNSVIIPGGADAVAEGDHVVVVTTHEGYDDLTDILA